MLVLSRKAKESLVFVNDDGTRVEVSVNWIKGRTVSLAVQDTGIGISPEDQEAIFERFKKLDDFVQGTGLGLSICQAIVKQLNGRILLKSEKNKGCRISLVFEL